MVLSLLLSLPLLLKILEALRRCRKIPSVACTNMLNSIINYKREKRLISFKDMMVIIQEG